MPRGEQPEGDVIGRLHAPEQRARQHEETKANDAAGKMRKLENCQRQKLPQHFSRASILGVAPETSRMKPARKVRVPATCGTIGRDV